MPLKDKQRKLQKLLALSASPNQAEADAAMQKCNKLMREWGIRTIDIDEETNEADICTMCVDGYTKRHRSWESKLAAVISACFDAEAIILRKAHKWSIIFISSASESTIIVELYKRLRRIISQLSKEYCRTHAGRFTQLQKAYAFGMIETIYERLITIYKDLPETRALVLLKKDAINDMILNLFGNIGKNRSQDATDRKAYIQGTKDGRGVNLHISTMVGSTS